MLHAQATAEGAEFYWAEAGEVDEEIQEEFDRLLALDIGDLI